MTPSRTNGRVTPRKAKETPASEDQASWYSYLPSEPATYAPFVFFQPGEHELAFTAEECERIVALADAREMQKGTVQKPDGLDPKIRDADVASLPVSPETIWVFERIHQLVRAANNWWGFDITHLLSMEVLRYREAQHYVTHTDIGPGFATRKISLSVQLSDPADYKGGDLELRWADKPERMHREQGSVIVFPSWTLHRVTPVKSGERRAMTAWVQGPAFR